MKRQHQSSFLPGNAVRLLLLNQTATIKKEGGVIVHDRIDEVVHGRTGMHQDAEKKHQ